MKTVATVQRFLLTIALGAFFATWAMPVHAAQHQVNCDVPGQRLTKAIRTSKPGDSIVVHGVCQERLTITEGPLTLEGDGTWVIDGAGLAPSGAEFNGLITVDGAHGITIRSLTIKNGSGEGILGTRGASMVVQNALVEGNITGIGLSNSAAEVVDSAIRNNGGGIDAFSSSTVIFRGDNDLSQNLGGGGLTLNGNSLAEIRGGHVQANNNAGLGVLVSTNSTLVIFGFQASQGSRLTTNGNQEQGIVIGNGRLFVAGATLAPGGILITSSGNAGPGVLLVDGSLTSPFGAARFVIENNPVGVQFLQGSNAFITGGLNVRNNAVAGIQADNAAGLTLVSTPPNPSTIQSNGTDVILGFGTKSTIDGVVVGTIVCDATVLSRGTSVCP